MAKITSCKDLLMLLLGARGHRGLEAEPIHGRTRFMKMVFLFDKEVRGSFNLKRVVPDTAIPDFAPYDFGPFSDKVFTDLEFLVNLGFVKVTRARDEVVLPEEAAETSEYWQAGRGEEADGELEGPEYEEVFELSNRGKQFVRDVLRPELSDEQWSAIEKFKASCTGATLRSLLRYVYERYSDMTTKSKIRDEILSD